MQNIIRTLLFLTATILSSGCVIDRPASSDLEGPVIAVSSTGGATFSLDTETRRTTPADNCAIVSGPVIGRSINLTVPIVDRSGMSSFVFTVEGNGITPSSIRVSPEVLDIRDNFSDSDFIDEIELIFLPMSEGVRNGAILEFAIESPFTPGVTISAIARDSFGNESRFERFELRSELANSTCNY